MIRMKSDGLRHVVAVVLLCTTAGATQASSPPPDPSPRFFAGEWAGTGDQGSYCYLNLSADGWGWVLVDGGAGDWLGARIRWHNQQQSLRVDEIIPARPSTELRVMRLDRFVLGGGFNQSLRLTWKDSPGGCELQRVDSAAARLGRAREVVTSLRPAAAVK